MSSPRPKSTAKSAKASSVAETGLIIDDAVEESGFVQRPNRVRGWLLVLSVWLSVGYGIGFVTMAITVLTMSDLNVEVLMFLYCLVMAYGMVTGVLLWARRRYSVTNAKIFLLLQPVLWGIPLLMTNTSAQIAQQAGSSSALSIFISMIWFFYLMFSKRVRATYNLDGTKSPVIAFILGAMFGPFGTLYFGFLTFLSVFLASVVSVIIMLLLSVDLPLWTWILWLPYNAVACLVLCSVYNDTVRTEEDPKSATTLTSTVVYSIWVIRVGVLATALVDCVRFIQHGNWLPAIVAILVVVPFTIWLAGQIAVFIQIMVLGFADWWSNHRARDSLG